MATDAPLRVGVVGTGIGKAHIAAYRQLPGLFEVEAICDPDAARGRAAADEHGVPRVVGDVEALLALDLDILDICTPSHLHYAQAVRCLEAGRHVIVEKPAAGSLAEIDRLAEVERSSGRRIAPVFQYRFGNGLARLQHLRARGVVGRPYVATVETHWRRKPEYYRVGPWRGHWPTELGGCLITHAIHAHDILVQVLGPVHTISARIATKVNRVETEDCAAAILEMENGALVTLSATLGSEDELSRLRFCFEGLTVESSHDPYAPAADPWRFIPGDETMGRRIEEALADFSPIAEGYVGLFAAIHRAIKKNEPLPVSLADARASLELLTALYHSAASGETVRLPIRRDHPCYGGWPHQQGTPG